METLLYIIAIGVLLALAVRAAVKESSAPPPAADEAPDIYKLSARLYDAFQATAHPSDVAKNGAFADAAQNIAKSQYTNEELIRYALGDNSTLATLAVEALSMRDDRVAVRAMLLENINGIASPWTRHFALRALHALTPPPAPLVIELLARLDDSWSDSIFDRFTPQFLKEFIQLRLREGEKPETDAELDTKGSENIHRALRILEPQTAAALKSAVEKATGARVDVLWLESIGKVWKGDDLSIDGIVRHDALLAAAAEIENSLAGDRRRPVLQIGDPGVGKSVLIRVVARNLHDRGWTVFEAGFNELLAGQTYIGQFEERMQSLVRQLRKRRVVWIINELPSLLLAGRHQYSPTGALDVLLPYLESGEIVVLGAAEPSAHEKLLQDKPRLGTTFHALRLHPLKGAATLELARAWCDLHRLDPDTPLMSADTLDEAWQLTLQYLGAQSSPGNLLDLLKITRDRIRAVAGEGTARRSIEADDLIATLAQLTGLPEAILDERQDLDLEALRKHFGRRVLGQREAIDVLTARIAMIKAGLNDPTRPLGVFLFAGPTGTGKTEIAKSLAQFLFGSADRMIRIDMSELQTPEGLSRLIGDVESNATSRSLVDQIRRQPFSIVLLDEFEKAHPNVWDLFLQLFDDGRLTDRRGLTADFRHALIIMTSNLGAAIQTAGRMGFSNEGGEFQPHAVRTALEKQFRKEFLNRIDRIVVFRPLSRETMRGILKKELADIDHRRGLRNRPWAVEWDESAIDFLLEKGFTLDLGARPLKRAIDEHLLSPLATSIVERSLPMGEQLLYVRSDGERLVIDFIDAEPAAEVPAGSVPATGLSLQALILNAQGSVEEIAFLETAYEKLQRIVREEGWRQKKEIDLSMMALPEFWSSPDRFAILTKAEYRDRIEAGLETAGSLLERVRRKTSTRGVIERLAQQLFLLESGVCAMESDIPWEAFVHIDAGENAGEFAERIRQMYNEWAKRRGMRIEALAEGPREQLLAVSGFAAYSLLMPEHGIHVLETPRGDAFDRLQVRVRVAPQPAQPLPRHVTAARSQALEAVKGDGDGALQIVRRYRELPSPLVRDAVRNWRSGRIDLVFDGNFDVITSRE